MVRSTRSGVVILVISLLVIGHGCGSNSTSNLPAGQGTRVMTLARLPGGTVDVERSGSKGQVFKAPVDLFARDLVSNGSPNPILLESEGGNIAFSVMPATQVRLDPGRVELIQGRGVFTFRKIEGVYKIVLPTATLGIRGTILDISTSDQGVSLVRLLEGKIDIDKDGQTVALTEGQTALIGKTGEPVRVNPGDNELPEFLKRLQQQGQNEKAIQRF